MTRQQAVERIARFLHLNYPTDCCQGKPWEQIDGDCREGWLVEAAHIYDLAHEQTE